MRGGPGKEQGWWAQQARAREGDLHRQGGQQKGGKRKGEPEGREGEPLTRGADLKVAHTPMASRTPYSLGPGPLEEGYCRRGDLLNTATGAVGSVVWNMAG